MKFTSVLSIVGKVLLTLLMVTPILGTLGIFPAPTPDMYRTPEAYQFVRILMTSGYVMWMSCVVYVISIICLWTKRTHVAALLLLPITLNIIGFHLFLDHTAFAASGIMGDVMFLLNLAFLYQQRAQYRSLWQRSS